MKRKTFIASMKIEGAKVKQVCLITAGHRRTSAIGIWPMALILCIFSLTWLRHVWLLPWQFSLHSLWRWCTLM